MGLRPSVWVMKWDSPSSWDRRVEWLLRPAPRSWRAVGLVILLSVAVSASLRANWGSDNAFVVKAADALLAGVSPYEDKRFLYLPSAVIMAIPEALLPTPLLRCVLPLGMTGLVGLGWWAALRLFSVPVRSRLAVGGFGLFALAYKPYINLVLIGNWTAISVAALPVALLLAHRRSWGPPGWWWAWPSRASRCWCRSRCSSSWRGSGAGWPWRWACRSGCRWRGRC